MFETMSKLDPKPQFSLKRQHLACAIIAFQEENIKIDIIETIFTAREKKF